jgi:prephenate dehydratase
MKIAYLGPTTSFCNQAADEIIRILKLETSEVIESKSIFEVFAKVEEGEIDLGVVPLENALEGSVPITLQCLAYEFEVDIVGEFDLKIALHLCSNEKLALDEIKTVYSHPHALAQAAHWLHQNMPHVETVETNSTSAAAIKVLEQKDTAAVCGNKSSSHFNLELLEQDIHQNHNNETRFILIKRKEKPFKLAETFENWKTSIVCFQKENKPGSLFEILNIFKQNKVDFTKLESRPTKEGLGSYCFFMDFVGHLNDEIIKKTLKEIESVANYKFLGSYPIIK